MSDATFSICAIVPTHNHHTVIAGLVAALRRHDLPVIVVDDGSGEETRRELATLAGTLGVELVTLPVNQGKGAACKHAMRLAAERGHTHALQLDADGQHDPADVPRFVAAARAHPEALVLGVPIYDESVPKSRLIGRYLTHVWVWIETLSLAIRDSMCGFRVYPLAPALTILDSPQVGDRMEFDPSIAVRLCWLGVPILNLRTPVTYPADGRSNFRLFRDNVRISWMHTRLVVGMLWRLHRLLVRRPRLIADPNDDWLSLGERGSYLGMRFTMWVYRLFGYRLCAVLVQLVVAYFWLTGTTARRASRQYFERLHATTEGRRALGHAPGWRDSWGQFREYGYALLDKLAVWRNDLGRHQVDWPEGGELHDRIDRGHGLVLLGAHLGNIEVIRAMSQQLGGAHVNALMIIDNAPKFNRLIKELNPDADLRLIATSEVSADLGMVLNERLDRGELVALLGDRVTRGSRDRVFRLPFLGHETAIPQGPFILASLLDRPVFLLFVTRVGFRRYHVHQELLAETLAGPRADRLQRLEEAARLFVARLEAQCCRTPWQWFNFYAFWQ